MTASRLRKRLARSLMVSWREQPTRFDIEALQDNISRVGLVIRVRWVLIVVLVLYSALAAGFYATKFPVPALARLMWIPALALGFVVLYNTFYSLNYRRLGNIVVWNALQLALDAFVVTVLVYFSGGAHSWFWSMYSLFILEAAFILPRPRDVWLLAVGCMALLGGIEWLEFARVLPHQNIPYTPISLHSDLVFVSVRYLWQVTVLAGTASIASLLVGEFRRQIASRSSQTILDNSTGLFSRGYFMRAYQTEFRRALRDGRPIHLILIDIDDFGAFNARFGIDTADRLLVEIANAISRTLSMAGDVTTSNILARIGGEEFAVLFAEDERVAGAPSSEDALGIANQIRAAAQAAHVEEAGVTVSVGVATILKDGSTAEELMDAADAALSCAIDRGGNAVFSAGQCPPLAQRRATKEQGQ